MCMLWVATMYNALAVLSMADMVCLACMQKLLVHEQCWVCIVCMVCMVCMVYGLYIYDETEASTGFRALWKPI